MQQIDDNKKKKLKFLIFLPLFLILLTGLIASGLYIVQKNLPEGHQQQLSKSAFNTKLPSPSLPAKEKNKFELYMEAAKDSAKRRAEWDKDPNNRKFYDPYPLTDVRPIEKPIIAKSSQPGKVVLPTGVADPNEAKVNERLAKLYAALNQSGSGTDSRKTGMEEPFLGEGSGGEQNPETSRLEMALRQSHVTDTTVDPNLLRAEKVLDKVLDIQHPDRVAERIQPGVKQSDHSTYSVSTCVRDTTTTERSDQDIASSGSNAFYGLQQESAGDSAPAETTIQAVVHETQSLQNGSTIKLRLLQDVFIGGRRIPANNFIYGQCAVNSERLDIRLTSAVCNDEIYPISLKVYDTDGLEGIYVPGAITRDVTKDGISHGVSGMGITSLDNSVGAQAASAGIETAKNLLSRKIKAMVVTVKAGHRVLLQTGNYR